MMPNNEDEIALRDEAISILEEEVSAKNELIDILKAQIRQLEEYNSKLVAMVDDFLIP